MLSRHLLEDFAIVHRRERNNKPERLGCGQHFTREG
jgi:hypothetical protein